MRKATPTNLLPSGNSSFAWAAVFASFVFLLISFNRSFAYLHVSAAGFPIYVTEIFLFLAAVRMALHRDWLRRAASDRGSRLFVVALMGLLALVLLKLVFQTRELSSIAIRNAALGYYVFAGLAGFAVASDNVVQAWCRRAFILGAVVSTVCFWTMILWPDTQYLSILQGFHGLPALTWAALGALSMISLDVPSVGGRRAVHGASVILLATPLMVGGRSVVLSTILSVAVFVLVGWRRLSTGRRWAVLGGVALGLLLAWVRMQNVFSMGSQDVWADSWRSWSEMATTVDSIHEPQAPPSPAGPSAEPLAPVNVVNPIPTVVPEPPKREAPPVTGVPESSLETFPEEPRVSKTRIQRMVDVYNPLLRLPENWDPDLTLSSAYYPAHEILLLISPRLNGDFVKRRLSSSLNNAVWRLELWRLATLTAFRLYPVTGIPLQVSIHFGAFDFFNYSTRTDLHNSHLAYYVRFGLMGALLYFLAVGSMVGGLIRRCLAGASPADAFFAAGLVLLSLLACFNVMLEGPFLGVPYWIFLGAAVARSRRPD